MSRPWTRRWISSGENLKTPPIGLTIGEAIFSHGRGHAVLESIVDFSDPEHNQAQTIPVQVRGDALDEINESFKLLLSGPTNATIATGTGTCTINDNDAPPAITITDP